MLNWLLRLIGVERRLAVLEGVAADWVNTMEADDFSCCCDEHDLEPCPLCRARLAIGACTVCGARRGRPCDAGLHS